jgi:flagellar biogenesis protein FliO
MDWGSGMHLARISENHEMKKSGTMAAPDGCGLVGWVLDLLRSSRGQREARQKQMRLVETLALGGKKQLMLVTCAGESFLIGGGMDSVETIVRLRTNVPGDDAGKDMAQPCQ